MYRAKESKRGIRFTVLLCGAPGTGKTSFVNTLLDQNLLPHKYTKGGAIPKTITFTNLSTASAVELQGKFDPLHATMEPGIAITETSVEIVDEDESKILLTVINTPGFGENVSNEVCVTELATFLEQQFDLVLAEETKVHRNPRFQDTRVHLCIYFIEPTGHGLRELDVATMLKISKYVNILPVVARADAFTVQELHAFKQSVRADIKRHRIPVFNFALDAEDAMDDPEAAAEAAHLAGIQPFAVITSDETIQTEAGPRRVRNYPWGMVDVMDPACSDMALLKSVVLGSHLQEFKDITHDFLYESYRTERLSSVANLDQQYDKEPSMSNLAEIAQSKSMRQLSGELPATTPTTPAEPALETLHELDTVEELIDDLPSLAVSPNPSSYSLKQPQIDSARLRKISETVPYVLRHESLRSKQAKLEDLERQSALELAKRAAELERRAMELKLRERELRQHLEDSAPASPQV